MTRLAKILEQAGIRQSWIAEKTGLTKVSINRYVRGNRVPKVTNAIKIARALGMTVEMIWGGEEDERRTHE